MAKIMMEIDYHQLEKIVQSEMKSVLEDPRMVSKKVIKAAARILKYYSPYTEYEDYVADMKKNKRWPI